MAINLLFVRENIPITVPAGTTLLQAMAMAGLAADAPCGGRGTCGKCLVEIRRNDSHRWTQVLACQTVPEQDLLVRTPEPEKLHVLTQGQGIAVPWEPWAADASGGQYMAAFDLGTTTLAGYLLGPQGIVARNGRPNPQIQFGADVIQRIQYALQKGVLPLQDSVRRALDELLGELCDQAGICRDDVLAVSLVGNTCMHHLFLGIHPATLARVPYSPTVWEAQVLSCREYGLRAGKDAPLLVLPVIAGFVGADTVGCLVAGDWANREKLTLLIDIGTNGELVLGNRHRRIACSTAAGPAFEGALISCGMRGAPGAVDHVWLEQGAICHSVIGGGKALGICGSGLIDFVAVLLETGGIDASGATAGHKSITLPGTDLSLTQKDIRQVQLAKAAISAGIRLLARYLGTALEDIEEVCIAGAFGTYMDPDSACRIGLIPSLLRPKLHPVGNAAGEGAALVLYSRSLWAEAQNLARQTEFLELATLSDFQDIFVDELEFPEG